MNSRVLPILSLLVSIGIFFAYVRPLWSGQITETKAAIAADEQALVTAGEYATRQNQLASERNAINQKDLARISAFLPDSVDNVRLILDLNALAARSGLSLSNVDVKSDNNSNSANSSNSAGSKNPSSSASPTADSSVKVTQSVPASPVSSVDLSISAVGTYAALQNFLRDIEHSQRLLDVRTLSVKSSSTGVYSYQMTLRLYWLR